MFYSKSKTEKISSNIVVSFLKGLIVSMLVSFALIIMLALSLKWFSLDEKFISPINLAIKTISVVVGSCIAVKGESRGLIKGVAFGLLYIVSAFVSFSVLAKSFALDMSFLLDVLFAGIAGGIVGIIKVNRN